MKYPPILPNTQNNDYRRYSLEDGILHYTKCHKTEYFIHEKDGFILSVAENSESYGQHHPKDWAGISDILSRVDLVGLPFETDPSDILGKMGGIMHEEYHFLLTDTLDNGWKVITGVEDDVVEWTLLLDQDDNHISHSGRVADIVAYFVNHIDICGDGE